MVEQRRPWPSHYYPDDVRRHATPSGLVVVHVDDLDRWKGVMQNAFDLGFKAAGGSTIPDGARDVVELTLNRDQINELADMVEIDGELNSPTPGMSRFLEAISIYRRRK